MVKIGEREFKDGLTVEEFNKIMDENISILEKTDLEQAEGMIKIKEGLNDKINFLNKKMIAGDKFSQSSQVKAVNETYEHFLEKLMGI